MILPNVFSTFPAVFVTFRGRYAPDPLGWLLVTPRGLYLQPGPDAGVPRPGEERDHHGPDDAGRRLRMLWKFVKYYAPQRVPHDDAFLANLPHQENDTWEVQRDAGPSGQELPQGAYFHDLETEVAAQGT